MCILHSFLFVVVGNGGDEEYDPVRQHKFPRICCDVRPTLIAVCVCLIHVHRCGLRGGKGEEGRGARKVGWADQSGSLMKTMRFCCFCSFCVCFVCLCCLMWAEICSDCLYCCARII